MDKLKGKVAVVVGGTSGIGEATAKLFAKEGAKVVVSGLKNDQGEAIVKSIKNNGGTATFIQVDVTQKTSVDQCVNKVLDHYGTIDILYNGAGVHDAYKDALETDEQTFDQLIAVNVKGPYLFTNAVLPIFLEKGKGKIINIGSQSTFVAGAGGNTYVTSKHAMGGFTKQLAYDFGDKGIKANLVAPGFVETPMTEGIEDERLKSIPEGRAGKTQEIANVALFLASEDASYVQGAEIKVDGGWTTGR